MIEQQELARVVENSYNDPSSVGDYTHLPTEHDKIRLHVNQNNNTYIISHRGTKLNDTDDLTSDANLSFGKHHEDKQFKQRVKHTRELIDQIKRTNPNAKIILSGHSLGGSTALYAFENDDFIKRNIDAIHIFNSGKSPISSFNLTTDSEKFKEYRIEGDLISAGTVGKEEVKKTPFTNVRLGPKANIPYVIWNTLYSHTIKRFT